MKKLIEFYHTYPTLCFGIYFALAIMIDRMPAPDKDSGKFYRYAYSVLNSFAANLNRAWGTKLPSGLLNTEENAKAEGFVSKP
jgi:hypothetical protein